MRGCLVLALLLATCCCCCGARAGGTSYHLVTYATRHYRPKAERLAASALAVGGFDTARVYGPEDMDSLWTERNAHVLRQPRGAGYWIYKPYVLLFHMTQVARPGDVVLYMDAAYEFRAPLLDLLDAWLAPPPHIALVRNKPDESTHAEVEWSKRDAYVLMNTAQNASRDDLQLWAGFVGVANTFLGLQFVSAWLTYAQDERIVTDVPSAFGPEHALFVENRHDQTVCSLLAKKWQLPLHVLPSGPIYNHHLFGEPKRKSFANRLLDRVG